MWKLSCFPHCFVANLLFPVTYHTETCLSAPNIKTSNQTDLPTRRSLCHQNSIIVDLRRPVGTHHHQSLNSLVTTCVRFWPLLLLLLRMRIADALCDFVSQTAAQLSTHNHRSVQRITSERVATKTSDFACTRQLPRDRTATLSDQRIGYSDCDGGDWASTASRRSKKIWYSLDTELRVISSLQGHSLLTSLYSPVSAP